MSPALCVWCLGRARDPALLGAYLSSRVAVLRMRRCSRLPAHDQGQPVDEVERECDDG
jgi:hypothetical protein